ncbi:MAG: hypothetical protein OEY36_06590 [Gammaproteobacteria bacterium]|nr:hypothetical protein [Gammaproteobacteria bacterium]
MFSRFLILCAIILSSACSTTYTIESEPSGARIYRGDNLGNLKYFATTPYSDTSATAKRWGGTYIQLRKEGYIATSVSKISMTDVVGVDQRLRYSLDTDILIELVDIEKAGDLNAYYDYLNKYPNNQYKERMYDRMFALVKATDSGSEYERFLEYFSDSREQVYPLIYQLFSRNSPSLNESFEFLSRYPHITNFVPEFYDRLIAMIKTSADPVKNYYELLNRYERLVESKPDIIKNMVGLIQESKGDIDKQLRTLLSRYPASMQYMPARIRLADIGPEGMKVYQVIAYVKQGMSAAILRQKILNAGVAYKEFSFSEISELNEIGLPQDITAAMLEVTSRIAAEEKRSRQREEELETIARQRAEERERQQQQQQMQAQAQAQAEEKSTPVECLKLVAAIKVCQQTGGFLEMICKRTAEASFDCPLPLSDLM